MYINSKQCASCGGDLLVVRIPAEEEFTIKDGKLSLKERNTPRIQIRCSNFESHSQFGLDDVEKWRQEIIDTYF